MKAVVPTTVKVSDVFRFFGFQLQVTTWQKKSGDKRPTSTRLERFVSLHAPFHVQIKERLDKYSTHMG